MQRIEPGQKFGSWTTIKTIRHTQTGGKKVTKWECRCRCGSIGYVYSSDLKKAKSTKCRTCNGSDKKELTGKRFGRWKVINRAESKFNRAYWLCRCSCSKKAIVCQQTLLNKTSTKCVDCYFKSKEGPTSAHKKNPLYSIWRTMLARCYNPKHNGYRVYGKRGITVCTRWHDLDNFTVDMGSRPSNKHTIERIDNDGNYEPSNCRWATYKEQANNKRSNHRIIYKGITKNIGQWAQEMNIKADTLAHYLYRHSFEEAVKHYHYDDSLIASICARKEYSDNPRTEFNITELKDDDGK